MTMDFSLILFLLVCATGIIWGLDRFAWAGTRSRAASAAARAGGNETVVRQVEKEPLYVEYARSLFPVILAVFVLRSFVVEPFRIPSGSMLPSLHIGDFILVNKFAYGLRLPVLNKKFISIGEPERGDVMVFRYPKDPSTNYIKRVIGLPGDTVVYESKKLYINGKLMPYGPGTPHTIHQKWVGPNGKEQYMPMTLSRHIENLEGVEHQILLMGPSDSSRIERVVPAGEYFVMGDNRDQSNDSRVWGFVAERYLVGEAFLIWFSWDGVKGGVAFDRIGDAIH
jgi:signal peptidase I